MKKQTLNNIAKKFFAGSILAAALFITTQNKVYANYTNHNKISTEKSSNTAAIKYVGLSKENLLFNVKFDNASGETFVLTVTDEVGEVIYRTVSKEKQFAKTYALPKSVDVSKVTFSIKSGKTNLQESFDVNINTSVIENVVVSKS